MVSINCKPQLANGLLTLVRMSSLSDRLSAALISLKDRRPSEKVNQAWLARQVGISSAAIAKWFSGGTKSLDGENLLKASKALGVSPEWLANGKGQMTDLSSALGPAIQTPLRPVRVIDNPDQIEHDIFEVPRYTLRASAGAGEPVLEVDEKGTPNYCRSEWAKREGLEKSALFSMVVVGNSMEPRLPDGCSIIVHQQQTIANNRIHVLCFEGECYVKRLIKQMDGSLIVRSDNPDYKDFTIDREQAAGVHIVGLVVSVSFNV